MSVQSTGCDEVLAKGQTKRQKPEKRREQILEAAEKLFAEKGFDRTTIEDIAEACKVAPGLIYHYFDSKTEILKVLLESKSPMRKMEEILKSPASETLEATLIRLGEALWDMLEERKDFIVMLHGEMPRNREVAKVVGEIARTGINLLSTHLAHQKKLGRLRSDIKPEIFTRVFWGAIFQNFLAHHLLFPFVRQIHPKKLVREIVQHLLYGAVEQDTAKSGGEEGR